MSPREAAEESLIWTPLCSLSSRQATGSNRKFARVD